MKFHDYFKRITTDEFIRVTTDMMQTLFDGCSEMAYAVNHQHYLSLCPYNDECKIQIFEDGKIRVSGYSLSVPFVKLVRYFEDMGIEWRESGGS